MSRPLPTLMRSRALHRWVMRGALTLLVGLLLTGLLATAAPAVADDGVTTTTGVIDGASYIVQVPGNWNGTLLLWSHGYRAPGAPNPAENAPEALGPLLLAEGYALAGSSWSTTGWAVQPALHDQMALLNYFQANIGTPRRVIAWGGSLGGLVTGGLLANNPGRFDGALTMCGLMAGSPGVWNLSLDAGFALKTLIAPQSSLQLVNITNPTLNAGAAAQALDAAQATPQGRARIALAGAVSSTPGWFTALTPEPAPTDVNARQLNQYLWLKYMGVPFTFGYRANMEQVAGGNPSGNAAVSYELQLEKSGMRPMVEALYQQAGLDLNADLARLEIAPRIDANPYALDYLARYIAFDGRLDRPVLALHTTDDGLAPVQNEQAYQSVTQEAGAAQFLRQLYVKRAGHCTFSPAEVLTALSVLQQRVAAGQWGDTTNVAALNAQAAALGPLYNVISPSAGTVIPAAPAFAAYQPSVFLRPFTTLPPNLDDSYVTSLDPKSPNGPSGAGVIAISASAGAYRVRVTMSGLRPGSSHALRFHRGTCALPGPTLLPLPNLVADASGTASITAWVGNRDWAAIVSEAAYLDVSERASSPFGPVIACGNVS